MDQEIACGCEPGGHVYPVVSVNNIAAKQVLPANNQRVALILSPDPVATIGFGDDPNIADNQGLVLNAATDSIILRRCDLGAWICKAMYARATNNGALGIVEITR